MTETTVLCVVIGCFCIGAFSGFGRVLDADMRFAVDQVDGLPEPSLHGAGDGSDWANVEAPPVEPGSHDTAGNEAGSVDPEKARKAAIKDAEAAGGLDPADGLRMVRVNGIPMSMEALRQAVEDGHFSSDAVVTDADGNEILDENGNPLTIGALSDPLSPDLLSPVNYEVNEDDGTLLHLAGLTETDASQKGKPVPCHDRSMGRMCAIDHAGNQRPALYDETESAWYYLAANGEQVKVGAESSYVFEYTDAEGNVQQVALHGEDTVRAWHSENPGAETRIIQIAHPDGSIDSPILRPDDGEWTGEMMASIDGNEGHTAAEASSSDQSAPAIVAVAAGPDDEPAIAVADGAPLEGKEKLSYDLGQRGDDSPEDRGKLMIVTFNAEGEAVSQMPITYGEAVLAASVPGALGDNKMLAHAKNAKKGASTDRKPIRLDPEAFLRGAREAAATSPASGRVVVAPADSPVTFRAVDDPDAEPFTTHNDREAAAFKAGQDYAKGRPDIDVAVIDPDGSRTDVAHVDGHPTLSRANQAFMRTAQPFANVRRGRVAVFMPGEEELAPDLVPAFVAGASHDWVREESPPQAGAVPNEPALTAEPPPIPAPRPRVERSPTPAEPPPIPAPRPRPEASGGRRIAPGETAAHVVIPAAPETPPESTSSPSPSHAGTTQPTSDFRRPGSSRTNHQGSGGRRSDGHRATRMGGGTGDPRPLGHPTIHGQTLDTQVTNDRGESSVATDAQASGRARTSSGGVVRAGDGPLLTGDTAGSSGTSRGRGGSRFGVNNEGGKEVNRQRGGGGATYSVGEAWDWVTGLTDFW